MVANRPSGERATTPSHVEVMRYTLAQLTQRGIGFTVHALHHSLVADLHRDEWGPVGWPEWLHFFEADGSLRPGHEAVQRVRPSPVSAAARASLGPSPSRRIRWSTR